MAAYSRKAILEFFAKGDAATTSAKGMALEDLICYLFEKVPGLSRTNFPPIFPTASRAVEK